MAVPASERPTISPFVNPFRFSSARLASLASSATLSRNERVNRLWAETIRSIAWPSASRASPSTGADIPLVAYLPGRISGAGLCRRLPIPCVLRPHGIVSTFMNRIGEIGIGNQRLKSGRVVGFTAGGPTIL